VTRDYSFMRSPRLSSAEKVLMWHLTEAAAEDGEIRVCKMTLAREVYRTPNARRNIQRNFKRLEDLGLISLLDRTNRRATYRLGERP
jgi:hypothetical protein